MRRQESRTSIVARADDSFSLNEHRGARTFRRSLSTEYYTTAETLPRSRMRGAPAFSCLILTWLKRSANGHLSRGSPQ